MVDRATGRRVEDRDEECWGYVGSEYAEQTLEYTLLNTVMHLGAAVH